MKQGGRGGRNGKGEVMCSAGRRDAKGGGDVQCGVEGHSGRSMRGRGTWERFDGRQTGKLWQSKRAKLASSEG
eukprot:366515-Chlamydomonas_euryale.AAC.4